MKKRAELLGAGRARAGGGGGGVGPRGRASPKTTSPDAEFVKQQLRDQILASARSKRGNSFNQNRQAVRTEALGLCFSGLAANPSVVNLLGGAMGLMWIPPAPGAGGIAEETNENENMDLNGAATDTEELPSNSSTPCHRQGAASTNSNNPFSTSITRQQQQQQQQQQLMQRLQQHNQLHESDFGADGMGVANDDEIDQDQDQDEDDEQRDIDVDNGNGNGNGNGSGSGSGSGSGESSGESNGEGEGEGEGDGEEVNEQDLLIALFGRDAFDQLMIELEEVLLSGADAEAAGAGAGAGAAAAASYHYQSQGHGRRGHGRGRGHGEGEGEGEGSWVDYYAGIAPPPGEEEEQEEQEEHGQAADWDDSRVIVCPLCRRRPMEVDAVLLQGRCLCGPPLRLEGVAAALGPGAGAGAGLKEALEGLLAAEYAR